MARGVPALILVLTAAVLALAACGATGDDGPARSSATTSAPPASGSLGADLSWQWQLQGPLNASYEVDLYDVDLFETSAETIAALHDDGRLVLCYFSAGSGENWRPDYDRIPAATLGEPLDGWEGERWLDVRARAVRDVMRARLDLAQQRGCDGVEPDNVTAWENETGFAIDEADQVDFNRWLAHEAHDRDLLVALKNAGALAAELVKDFDLALNEECHAFRECEQLRPFLAAGKAVLNAEYADDPGSARALAASICPQAKRLGLRTVIYPLELDDGFRVACD